MKGVRRDRDGSSLAKNVGGQQVSGVAVISTAFGVAPVIQALKAQISLADSDFAAALRDPSDIDDCIADSRYVLNL